MSGRSSTSAEIVFYGHRNTGQWTQRRPLMSLLVDAFGSLQRLTVHGCHKSAYIAFDFRQTFLMGAGELDC